nr:hypothetical protein [Tanacetum cinerariifolium]
MQTQTSNTLHNAIMDAGSKDRPPMLASGWEDKPVPDSDGNPTTTTERVFETYKNVTQDIRDQLNAEAEADGESLESYYSRFYKMMNELIRNQCKVTNHQVNVQFLLQLQPEWQRSQQAATRNKGKAIVNSPQPIYDQEPSMVDDDDETSKDKEIDKLMALISLSNDRYDSQRSANVVGARETVGSSMVHNDDHYDVFAIECQHPEQSESVHETYHIEQDAHNVIIESMDMNYDSEQIDKNDEDADLSKEGFD